MEIHIQTLNDINQAARTFVDDMGDRKIFAFYGNMGAGKTTFIKKTANMFTTSISTVSRKRVRFMT